MLRYWVVCGTDVKKCPGWTPTACGQIHKDQPGNWWMHRCNPLAVPKNDTATILSCKPQAVNGTFQCYFGQVSIWKGHSRGVGGGGGQNGGSRRVCQPALELVWRHRWGKGEGGSKKGVIKGLLNGRMKTAVLWLVGQL